MSGLIESKSAMVVIRDAETQRELDDTRDLMRAFLAWHRERHTADRALVERYFDQRAFDAELAGLPGKYAQPGGRLLIAYRDRIAAGCVALRDLGRGVCEMKRMFVPVAHRGAGIGRALADRIVAAARDAGYDRMRLDTSKRQREAMTLYASLGFARIAPYYDMPEDVRDWLMFFELALR